MTDLELALRSHRDALARSYAREQELETKLKALEERCERLRGLLEDLLERVTAAIRETED